VRDAKLILAWFLVAASAYGSPVSIGASRDDRALLSISIGHDGLRRPSEFATEGRIEFRSGQQLWVFTPFGGVMANSSGSLYGFAGLLTDFYLPAQFVFTPSVAAGLYRAGSGKDLGFPLEFRSQIELSYQFLTGARVGIGASHISNAKLGSINPGIEAVFLTFSTPIIPVPRR
jgi:hypothetical protein